MPIFSLTEQYIFPPPQLADPNGLLAVGGDLAPDRLLKGYKSGIFPWFSPGDPLLWWYPTPRLIIVPQEFHIPNRVKRYAKKSRISITRDLAFQAVIRQCAEVRTECGNETWITPEMEQAYIALHKRGYAHSVECWKDERLVGGLYGVALDRVFFGESMFSREKCASQFALIHLVQYIKSHGFGLIDCQMTTSHLLRFGAKEVSGAKFQRLLREFIQRTRPQHAWNT